MLQNLFLENLGPAPSFDMGLAPRLNLFTGDNGLGKSFLLDVAWWALTRRWPGEVNPRLLGGRKALPSFREREGTIRFSFTGRTKPTSYESRFQRETQSWVGGAGRPANPGLVLYALAEGSFALWDPARNYWRTQKGVDVQDRPPAYVFSPRELWDGLQGEDGGRLCNGLIQDWAGWQKERGEPFRRLRDLLRVLGSPGETLEPGALTRVSLDDLRDIPTLRMPYGQEVPVVHASSGMRRILALAYLLLWGWEEHRRAAALLGQEPTDQVVFLVDEVEAHLHPRWQFAILRSLLGGLEILAPGVEVQLLVSTHSPQVLASLETVFDAQKDAWFDLDWDAPAGQVLLQRRPFEPHGEVSNWLTSEAFDLPSSRDPRVEELLGEAGALLKDPHVSTEALKAMEDRLSAQLNPRDGFLFRWRYVARTKGLAP